MLNKQEIIQHGQLNSLASQQQVVNEFFFLQTIYIFLKICTPTVNELNDLSIEITDLSHQTTCPTKTCMISRKYMRELVCTCKITQVLVKKLHKILREKKNFLVIFLFFAETKKKFGNFYFWNIFLSKIFHKFFFAENFSVINFTPVGAKMKFFRHQEPSKNAFQVIFNFLA